MTSLIFALLAATMILLAGFVSFSSSAYHIFKMDFFRQASDYSGNTCLAYGDLLMRTGSIPKTTTFSNQHTQYSIGCISSMDGVCEKQLSCRISVNNENKIIVALEN